MLFQRAIRTGLVLSLVAAAAGFGANAPAIAAAAIGGCSISGTAAFSSPVTTTAKSVTYTFSGNVASCSATQDKTVKSGSVSASGGGSTSCAKGTTSGSGGINWNNGQSSSFSFSTTSVGSLVSLSGKFTGGEFAGQSIKGVLSFTTTAPQKCVSGGLSQLGFVGAASV